MRVEIQHYGPGRVIAKQGNNVWVLLDRCAGKPTSKIRPKAVWAYGDEWHEIDKPTPFQSDVFDQDPNELREGMTVEHAKFGIGRVVKVMPPNMYHSTSNRAIIDFEETGPKTLLLAFAKLKIIR